jgi:murein DD-endopeptidase MepM/ murein hydrolase activator NlpD
MFIKTFRLKKSFFTILIAVILVIAISVVSVISIIEANEAAANIEELEEVIAESKDFIKWVDFNVPYNAMEKALNYDIKSYNNSVHLNWVELLAYLGARYGGNYKKYKAKDMEELVKKLNNGETMENLTENLKYYGYYKEAYDAVLGGFVGSYSVQVDSVSSGENSSDSVFKDSYGLKVFSPIARGYNFSHSDDFGNSRSYGFKRKHLGNDLMGSIGTPVIAVESGIIEELGWNKYGGWRIGIRSLDRKRYYYYAHLRKDRPFHTDLYKGKVVTAGDVIGYLGMTGYSTNENVNNIQTPHLHFGMQLVFDESQKECNNEIWIDVYSIVKLLNKNKSAVSKAANSKDYNRVWNFIDPAIGG